MNTHSPAHSSPVEIWQQANEARLQRNAQRWAESRETTLYTEEWGRFYVAVTREGQRLVLWMLDTESANTDWIQSAMNLRAPLRLQSSYTQAMILTLIWQPSPQSVFLSGLGGGCLATTLHHHLTGASFVCVEIAAPVVTAATRYFGCQPDDRLSIIVSDVRDFLDNDRSSYDLMFLDVFCDHGVTPEHATEPDFLAICRGRIRENGLLAMNLGNRDPAFAEVRETLGTLFATVYACPGRGSTTVFFATDQLSRSAGQLRHGATELEKRHDFLFPLLPWLARLEPVQPTGPEIEVNQGEAQNPER